MAGVGCGYLGAVPRSWSPFERCTLTRYSNQLGGGPLVSLSRRPTETWLLDPAETYADLFLVLLHVGKLFRMNRARVGINPTLKIRLGDIVHVFGHNIIVRRVVNKADHPQILFICGYNFSK